jgi:hypothetical protein
MISVIFDCNSESDLVIRTTGVGDALGVGEGLGVATAGVCAVACRSRCAVAFNGVNDSTSESKTTHVNLVRIV